MKNNIAVIIVTFNGEKWIQKCLDSILNADCKLQIFVIDNASTDGTIKLIGDFTTIQVIESKINLGFGKANNLAVKKAMEAGFDTFFLLNQDTWIFEHTVSNLVQKMNENPNYGILSPLHYSANGIDLDSNFEKYYNNQATINSNIKNTDFVNAAAWLVSKKCFEKVGFFDPIFSHYGEDRNFCNRVLYHNFEIGIVDNAKICHDRIVKRSFEKDILQSKYLILNNLIDINHPLLFSITKSFKQVFGLSKFFFKEYKFKKSLLFLHELLIYFFGTLVNLNQIMAIRKASKKRNKRSRIMQNKNTQKQAFFFTIINYVGILIGIVSTLFIYPKNKEMLGVFRYVESIAQILFPVLLLGASQSLINFYPKLNESHQKKLFNYSIFSILLISGIALIVLILASNFSFLKGMKYVYFAFPIAVFLALIELFKKQATIIQKIAIPTFFDNILPKIALPLLFILVLQQVLSTIQSLFFYILSYGLILILITWYLFYHFRPKIDFDFKSLFVDISKKEYYRFSAFAFAGSLGSVFAFRIDAIMIKSFFSLESVGTFSIGVTLASAIAIPATGIFSLYAPIISDFLKNNQLEALNKKYKETAKLLFFIGAILYSCIFLGIENLFQMLPTHENLMASVPIILILGFNVLVNMGTGFNGEIITYSKFYKFNLIAIALLVILNVTLNLVFILVFKLGIEAVAYASLLSMLAFNLSKLWFIYRKFKLFPFDKSFLKLVLVFSSVLLICYFLPNLNNTIQDLVIKISICLVLNLFFVYKLKLVYSFNFWLDKIKK